MIVTRYLKGNIKGQWAWSNNDRGNKVLLLTSH